MDIRTGYRNEEKYRKSLAALARMQFGIDLEGWYQNGFWQGDYIPYSVIENEEVISNVSVNVCNFKMRKQIHHLAQIGTVVTHPDHRNKGLASELMRKAIGDCERSFEGIYLYCEEHNVGFYERFGFVRTNEYRCTKKVNITNPASVERRHVDSKENMSRMVDIIQRRAQYGERTMVGNTGLFMFYLTGPFADNVYYVPSSEAYVVASVEDDTLTLYAVFADEKISLGDIITSFGSGIRRVNMGFMPENNTGFELKKEESEDSILMTRGAFFKNASNERFMFPEISRA